MDVPIPFLPLLSYLPLMGVPFEDLSLYKLVVGSLQYVIMTRPKLAYCVNRVYQFMQNPLEDH